MKTSTPSKEVPPAQPKDSTLQSFASLCTTLTVALFVLTFVIQNFVIPSASMASTLLVGDHVLADRASLSPPASWAPFLPYRELQRGEPVVFYKPVAEPSGEYMTLVKRVVAIPGDRIHLRRGILYINGVAQIEPRAGKSPSANYDAYRDDFPSVTGSNQPGVTAVWSVEIPLHIQGDDLVVPPDRYFMMGDNRVNSLDSRYWGFVRRENLIGRPLLVYWSIETPEDRIDQASASGQVSFMLHEVLHFVDETRWRRTLHKVN